MKRLVLFFSLIFPLLTQAQELDTLSAEYIREHAKPASSKGDLSFLKKELEGVEIALLGEQGHGDGSTFEVKTAMIKYLHEELGFNVLAFESGMLDSYEVWQAIQSGADSLAVFNRGIFPVWTRSIQVQSLFQYILDQAKTDHPLVLTGFDMQPTGTTHQSTDRFREMDEYLAKAIGANWQEAYQLLPDIYANTRKIFAQPLSEADMNRLEQEFRNLSRAVVQHDNSVKGRLMSRAILNYLDTILLYSNADMRDPSNTPHIFNLRDKRMAENFHFLKEEMFPGEKIIGWGANTHFGYGRGLLGSIDGEAAPEQGMVPMGQYLKIDYRDKLYTMAFTSYAGQSGSMNREPFDLPPAKPGSIEHVLHSMGMTESFMSLRDKTLAPKHFVTLIYGHGEMSAKWALMADGIYYIDQMEASAFK